jgi:hypothetical protein
MYNRLAVSEVNLQPSRFGIDYHGLEARYLWVMMSGIPKTDRRRCRQLTGWDSDAAQLDRVFAQVVVEAQDRRCSRGRFQDFVLRLA